MFPQNRHNTANSASSSHHQSGTSGPGVAGTSNTSGMKLGATNSGTGAVKELLDKVYEEFGVLQQQLHNTRIELEKCQQEKDGLQRYSMMMNESLFSLNLETQKHIEIGKRLSGILTHVIPMLPQEHQGSAVSAIERAKAVGTQELLTNHLQQQQLAAMMSVAGPAAAAAAFNPAMMMAGMGLNLNVKPEDAMQQLFNNILKNPILAGANNVAAGSGGPPQPSCIPQQLPSSNHPLMPGPSSSSSVPPTGGGDEGRPSTHPGRASSVLNSTGGGGSRPRSGTGTPVSYAKRTKLEPEDGDGELEIDVQNDDAGSSAALSHHTNGRTSQPFHKGKDERDTASASSRDSATPRSGKLQLASTPGSSSGCPPQPNIQQLLPPAMADFFANNYGANRFPGNFNNQISGLFGMTPGGGGGQLNPSSLNALTAAMTTNGKSPAYAFKVAPGEQIAPVSFPPDVSLEPDVPKGLRRIGDLPHGDVVCAVTLAKDGRRVFTGGKGAVKVWDITERIFNSSTANASNDTSSGDDMGGVGSVETASNGGGGGRAASTEPWLPVATFPCLKDSYIRSCKLFSDGSTLIVGGETKTICILDVERGGEIKQTFDCEAEACYALAISQDCKTLFSCCSNGVVNVWDLTSGERIVQLIGHSDGASCVDISGDGQKLWTGGLDNTVRCWDIGARQQIEAQLLESQIFSLGCCPTDNWVAVGLEDSNVQVLNSEPTSEKYLISAHQSCWFVSTGKDNVVNCWRTPYGYRLIKTKEVSSVLSCDISEDDRFLLTGSGEKKASLYELSF
ncbi:unnamed protein product [Meloidogyne enterolobii]|uniref:Uncharacterized protein n=1 Tax=Meloidogyne enterolobii TaxID=390850 RepID=A0ACB1AG11_MELEN